MEPVISVEQASWMVQGAASILVASRDANNEPSITQALGSRISSDRCTLVVFVPPEAAATVLRDVRANGHVAIVFTNSRTTRAIQIKANEARVAPLAPGDDDRISAHIGALVREWGSRGLPEAVGRAILWRGDAPLVCLELSPHVAFDQTPGPRAGTPLPAP